MGSGRGESEEKVDPHERRYVVELAFPIAEERLGEVVARVAGELDVPEARLRTLLAGRVGPLTKPAERTQAERVVGALRRAGVPAVLAPAGRSEVAKLSSTGWLTDRAPLAEGQQGGAAGEPIEPFEGESAAPAAGPRYDDFEVDPDDPDAAEPIDWAAEFGGDPFSPPGPPLRRWLLLGALVAALTVLGVLQYLSGATLWP